MAKSPKTKKQKNGGTDNAFVAFFQKKPVSIALKSLGMVSKFVLTILLIGFITASVVGTALLVYVMNSFDASESLPSLQEISLQKTSVIYVQNDDGDYVEHLKVKGANSVWTKIEDIPEYMQNAVIAIEDKRFRSHKGVDWIRTVNAAINMVLPSDSSFGGSTITQQLLKNLMEDDEVSVSRKVREIFRALEMEKEHATKQQILEAYLNILPLSSNVVGVGAAANYYFAKDIGELSLAECAIIAGITQNPSKFDPYLHPDNIKRRQETVLSEMYGQGLITKDEYIQAVNEELVYKSKDNWFQTNNYYNDLLIEQVIEELVKVRGYSKSYATRLLYFGGLKIYSNENPELQKKAEKIYLDDKNFPSKLASDKNDPQGAIIVLDYSGRIVVTVGGRGEKTADRVFNRSTDALRQPGSAMKPLASYAPSVENNSITYSTLLQDKKFEYNGSMWPPNYGGASGYGYRPAEEMLARSINTAAARLIMDLTPVKSFEFLTEKMRLTTLVDSRVVGNKVYTDKIPSLALGGVTDGVKAIEMAAAYQTFGNMGKYNKPYTFSRVTRETDYGSEDVLLDIKPLNEPAISADTAYVMNRMLQQVVSSSYGTGGSVGKIGGSETFGKTGTTNNNVDVYFAGGTPYYVGASWFGYDIPKGMNGSQTSYARSLFKKVMVMLHEGLPAKTFDDKSAGTVEHNFCRSSGKLALPGCSSVSVGVYRPTNIPDYCNKHGG